LRVTPPDAALEERDRLVMAHTDLVKALAHRLAHRLPPQVEVSDLIGVGVLGLIDAATRYKPALGVPFDAFARRRIQGAMLDSLRELDWVPRSLRRLRRTVEGAIGTLRKTLGREPDEAEVAQALAMTMPEYERTLEQLRTLEICAMRSLEQESENGMSRLELLADDGESVLADIERKQLHQHLTQAIGQLPPRERSILAMYFDDNMTLAEIGAVIGVSESRISQLRSMAFTRLRASLSESLAGKAGRQAA
jgi:RNA polymerase sigma factor for flagellar operon FliA